MWTLGIAGIVPAVVAARLSDYVHPFIGTEGATAGSAIAGGNSFPGASRPWGMAKVGIDTAYLGARNATDCNAGFSPLGNFTGVSMMHVSGTGGVPTYGIISQMPLLGDLSEVNLADNTTYWQNRSFDQEEARVGYFKTVLLNEVEVEMAGSHHSGVMRYTFPESSEGDGTKSAASQEDDVHVLVDLTHILPAYSEPYNTSEEGARYSDVTAYSQVYHYGDLHIGQDASGQPSYSGSATYSGGWPNIAWQKLYFCGNFSTSEGLEPTSEYVTQNTRDAVPGAGTFTWAHHYEYQLDFALRPIPRSYRDTQTWPGGYMGIGALFSWTRSGQNASAEPIVESRLGISYISAEQACENVANELPAEKTFEDAVTEAEDEWENKVLNTIEIVDDGSPSSRNDTLKRMLYSALYQTALMPTDKTHENPYWKADDEHPYFDDYYTLWDTYRSVMPLYHLLYTETYSRMIKGLINIFTYEGFLPAGRAGNWNGRVQGGTHADMSLADAYVKSVRNLDGSNGLGELGDDIDWQEAYRAVMNDAQNDPVHNEDPVTPDGATKEGRGALDDYLSLHYITRNHSRSISRGVEYSQNDFAIYSMALGLNGSDTDDFRERSDWWQNQWNPSANTTLNGTLGGTFTGFPAPRNADGSWNYTEYDPLSCSGCGWPNDIYEAKVWETSFSAAPHDMAKLIELMGGDEMFVKRLDTSFVPGIAGAVSVGANNDAGEALYNPGNEPSFLTPFLYNYVPGHHWKTVNATRSVVDQYYSDQRFGYPGNIDAGAIPSWLVWNLIGFYPVAAQDIYLLSAPRFSSLKLKLFGGTPQTTVLHVTAENLSDESWYPQRVTLNGKMLDRSWVSHAEIAKGGELIFEMGTEPSMWDVGERPFSLSGWN